ncbi:DNA cytosine methyltransferase [Paraburkholderia sp. MM6662-R1]|uniref:DNA cytosine methyltransferase n=1 Tax=Paraburkholderia sp. MM6662-R1 TaxID=2991066 RepID=UPI003D206700
MITFGSVCSGIEAASVAWHPLGWRAVWVAEIDAFPSAVLACRYPSVPNLGDMRGLAARVRAGEIEAPDVLVGGTPCQAFSVAGLRAGLADARGALVLAFLELADAIDAARSVRGLAPCVVVWENVPGVLSSKDNAFGHFLAGLAGEGCALEPPGRAGGRRSWSNAGAVFGPRRTVAWRLLDAQYFRVAQRRRRCFVVSSARAGFDPTAVLFDFEGVRRDSPPGRDAGQDVAGTLSARTSAGGGLGTDFELGGGLQPVVCMAHGQGGAEVVSDHSPTLTCLHEAPIACYAFQPRVARNGRGDMGEVVNALTAQAGETGKGDAAPCVAVQYEPCAAVPLLEVGKRTGVSTTDVRAGLGVGGEDDPMFTLQAGAQHGVAVAFKASHFTRGKDGAPSEVVPPLSADADKGDQDTLVCAPPVIGFSCKDAGGDASVEVAPTLRAMGFDGSHANGGGQVAIAFDARQDPVSSPHTAGALGSSSPQSQAVCLAFQEAQSGVRVSPVHPTLDANNGPRRMSGALDGMAVRRLTPRECERLQGFPDDFTLMPYGRAVRAEKLDADWVKYLMRGGQMTREECTRAAADGPRYKALGNSMAVPCMRWLGRRIQAAVWAADST